MKKYLKYIVLALLGLSGVVFGGSQVFAMASQFIASTYGVGTVTGTVATTTFSWITPGTGTTTVVMQVPATVVGKYDSAYVGFEVTATSTPINSKLEARIEYSWDGVDYYSDTVASSTGPVMGVMQNELAFNIATSSNYLSNGTTTRLHAGFFVQTPTPFTRVVFFSPIGGANLSLHVRAQPIREIQVVNQ